jgi:hypothetical protein
MPDYLTSLQQVRSDVFIFTLYWPCNSPTEHAHGQAGQVTHFFNTNTITHKLKSGYQPQNTGEHKIPHSLMITVKQFSYPKHWKL